MKRALACLFLAVSLFAQGRLRPPAGLACSTDELTAYTGVVTAYTRTDSLLKLTLHTDADTKESFALKLPLKMRISGMEFRPDDWPKVEVSSGKLRAHVRATVWECKGGERQIDWQTPPE